MTKASTVPCLPALGQLISQEIINAKRFRLSQCYHPPTAEIEMRSALRCNRINSIKGCHVFNEVPMNRNLRILRANIE